MLKKFREKWRKFSVMFSVLALTLLYGALPVFATASGGGGYDASWVAEQMTSGLKTASGEIVQYIGKALVLGLVPFGIVVGIRVALRVFGSVSKGRG